MVNLNRPKTKVSRWRLTIWNRIYKNKVQPHYILWFKQTKPFQTSFWTLQPATSDTVNVCEPWTDNSLTGPVWFLLVRMEDGFQTQTVLFQVFWSSKPGKHVDVAPCVSPLFLSSPPLLYSLSTISACPFTPPPSPLLPSPTFRPTPPPPALPLCHAGQSRHSDWTIIFCTFTPVWFNLRPLCSAAAAAACGYRVAVISLGGVGPPSSAHRHQASRPLHQPAD